MVNSTTTSSASRRGLHDWLIQRFSAVYMAGCLAALFIYLVSHPGLSYLEWHDLFAGLTVKAVTLLFFGSLLWHAWIGLWTVLTDYVTCGYLRVCLQALILFLLAGCFVWLTLMLWGV